MILLVHLEVFRKIVDPLCENGDLNIRRPCVFIARFESVDYFALFLYR